MLNNILVSIIAVTMPILIVGLVLFFDYRKTQDKNRTLIEIAKNANDAGKIEDLIRSLDPPKATSIQMKRGGLTTLFVGVGLFLFGLFFLGNILRGAGLLVLCIGLGVFLAGLFFPDQNEKN